MRILVTQQGEQVIEQLERMNSTSPKQFNKLPEKRRNNSYSNFNRNMNTINFKSRNLPKNSLNSIYSFKEGNLKKPNSIYFLTNNFDPPLMHTKRHQLSMKKMYFPKFFVEKYESPSKSTVSIIRQTSNILQNLTSNSKEEEEKFSSRLFSFRDILNQKTIYNIKSNIIKNNIEKEKHTKINSSNFRTIYQLRTPIDKFNEIIDQPILNTGNLGLIKYFNEKKYYSPISIQEIVNSKPLRINKINKICESMYRDEEKQQSLKEYIQSKIKNKSNYEKLSFNKNIKKVKINVEKIYEKLEKYSKKIDNKQRYKEQFKELNLKYWNKYDFDKLNKKNTKTSPSKYLNSPQEEESSIHSSNQI